VTTPDEIRDAVYARATIGGRLPRGTRPAVLVVDFARGLTDPEFVLGAEMTAAVTATRRVLDAAREARHLIVFTTLGFEPGLRDAGLLVHKAPACAACVVGSPLIEIDDRLGRRDDELLLVKKTSSALFGSPLPSVLVSNGIDTVVLCGTATSGCVRATAEDLCAYGFPTLVPRECVADRAEAPHEASLYDIDAKYGDVIRLDEALAYLQGAAPERSEVGASRKAAVDGR
jgi:nicotinamidase-related amidase